MKRDTDGTGDPNLTMGRYCGSAEEVSDDPRYAPVCMYFCLAKTLIPVLLVLLSVRCRVRVRVGKIDVIRK